MRIGVDMLGLQSPHSRGRGIGRYAASLIAALIEAAPHHQFLFYAHPGLSVEGFLAPARMLPVAESPEVAINELASANPDHLDHLLILSPFEVGLDYAPPPKPLNGLKMSAVVYDLLPFLYQERHLTDPPSASKFYRNFERLRRYDRLLAISEATRADLLRLLGIPAGRVVNIQGASDPASFSPGEESTREADRRCLESLGIEGPYVFCVGSADPRKNLLRLIDAFSLLDVRIRGSHKLVVSCALRSKDADRIRLHAAGRGVSRDVVLTGEVAEDELRTLYRRCEVFAFPSLYEGLGLPLLEAMHCGAPVIAGNNSSQPEFVGRAGLLVNAHDPGDIAAKLADVLTRPALAAELRGKSPTQAARFRWDLTARRALDAIVPSAKAVRFDRAHATRPRIAVFSPFPPKASGIADYSARLVRELRKSYVVDLYHDAGYQPDLGRDGREFAMYDHRLFPRNRAILPYRAVLYQMGNSLYHRFVYDALLEHPGLVTLHDFGLAGFHHGYSHQTDVARDHFERELIFSHPSKSKDALKNMDSWVWDEGSVQDAFAARDLPMNRRIFDAAARVLVHSPRIRDRAIALHPEHREKLRVVPMGASPRAVDREEKRRIRGRFGLPVDGLLFASFGILHPSKMNRETIEAFEPVARSIPHASLLFVGGDLADGEARSFAESRGLLDRVRFLGRREAGNFTDLTAAVDVGICLRRPPTNGETSAALLDLLRHGIPTVVIDTGTFADYPEQVVRRVSWEAEGIPGLTHALLELAGDNERLGTDAFSFVSCHHGWDVCSKFYVDAIESCVAESGLHPIPIRRIAEEVAS